MSSKVIAPYKRLRSLRFLHSGKVRDLYEIDESRLLIVQTDRLSAFDVILPDIVPGKGQVLTAMSNFWFGRLSHVIPNHLIDLDPVSFVDQDERDQVIGRASVVRRLSPLPLEAIVRGYIAGSGWKDYQSTGGICGLILPTGLLEAQQLPSPIFTPSSKAAKGAHDENISFVECERLVGEVLASEVRDFAVRLYREAAEYAYSRGIIIADTKFEFGTDVQGNLFLIDEVLTPDSSRLWPLADYRIGTSPPSFDKQFVRDWLEAQGWNKRAPAPSLPPEVIARTAEKYEEALRLLTA
jgi:phosphoribosylaminoimidazole-succinocarboxamide synthase